MSRLRNATAFRSGIAALLLLFLIGSLLAPAIAADEAGIMFLNQPDDRLPLPELKNAPAASTGRVSASRKNRSSRAPVLLTISPSLGERGTKSGVATSEAPGRRRLLSQRIKIPKTPVATRERLGLSEDAYALADKWGLLERLSDLLHSKQQVSGQNGQIQHVVKKQALIEEVLSSMFDIRRTLNAIDRQVSDSDELRAVLTERRDRAIRLNSYADIVAGGITGILSGSLRLPGEPTRVSSDIIDIVEGVLEMGLAGYALKTEYGQDRMQKGVPNLLAKVIYPKKQHKLAAFPDSVWIYLNSVPAGSKDGLTRRQSLVHRWESTKYCLIHTHGHKITRRERARHVSGTKDKKLRLSIDLLEDRLAMLTDLRTEVTMMDDYLSEVFQAIRRN